MPSEIKTGQVYLRTEDGELQPIASTGFLKVIELDSSSVEEIENFKELINPKPMSITLNPTYKEWHRKKKGKRHIPYYITKKGVNPKILNKLFGGE